MYVCTWPKGGRLLAEIVDELIIRRLAGELGIRETQSRNAVALLDEGNTIPFIARYRKEVTGELDEDVLRRLEGRLQYLRNLEQRRKEVGQLIDEQGKLTPEIDRALAAAERLQEIEDIYRPFRPRRRTRASVARDKGLAPLADLVLGQAHGALEELVRPFVDAGRDVEDEDSALQGARDIVAEIVSDDPHVRRLVRSISYLDGIITSQATAEGAAGVYGQYSAFRESVRSIPSHRILAIDRGEREQALRVKIEVPEDRIIASLLNLYRPDPISPFATHLEAAVEDAYRRLVAPAMEREIRSSLTERAGERAIDVFAANLKSLLLQPPVRGKVVLGVDPGYRTGCKVAVVDETGKLLETATIYPHPPQRRADEAGRTIAELIDNHRVDVIVIGNGTASRETEEFVAGLVPTLPRPVAYTIVSEAGASVYSASPLAREELPGLDVSLRGAVSIARRIQDPLAELVKIEPKSIGVGQYQHDVDQGRLATALDGVVEYCVNSVGVELNTASYSLLSRVAGVKPAVARNIVAHRESHGKFRSRRELLDVPRLGEATYTQCAGFLRIADGKNPLDNTSVHPESYALAEKILHLAGDRPAALAGLDPVSIAADLGAGLPTVRDIIAALLRPGRDPRDDLPPPAFRAGIRRLEDLAEGMILQGTIRNVVDFGAFVDIGVGRDGLIHRSELGGNRIRHPSETLAVGDTVRVRIIGVDRGRERISLSLQVREEDQ